VSGERVWIPLALRANRAGKLAGANALGQDERVPPVVGTAVFQFFDQQVARTGVTADEATQAGFDPVAASVSVTEHAHYLSDGTTVGVWLLADRASGRLLGGAMVGPHSAAYRIDTVAACLHGGFTVQQLYDMDLGYAPVFGPAWSPLLICASKLLKQL
jgi:NADPH-dependent 2,4-dienoyl-CoA reductase/sulfur reductase-like enzyme